MLDSLNTRNGQTLTQLCAMLDMTRQSVSKHLAVLEAANLVTTLRRGREKLHFLNAEPINAIADRWITQYDQRRVQALADLKTALEQPTMDNAFVYKTFIKTTPEKLWQALTDPSFNRAYWGGVRFETDWKVGSPMIWHAHGAVIAAPGQVVLAYDPPRKLSFTWHAMTPEFGTAVGLPEDVREKLSKERLSRCTFEIEPHGDIVKLTVIHDDFAPGSAILEMVSEGWVHLISSLKTQLETGDHLPDPVG